MRILEDWAILLLVAMTALVVVGVFFRYALGAALSFYDEFAGYLLVWVTFYGAVIASYKGKHIGFETLVELLPLGARHVMEIIAELFTLGFQAVLFYYGWLLVKSMEFDTAISLPFVPMAWVYSVLPITGGLMLLISVIRILSLLRGELKGGP